MDDIRTGSFTRHNVAPARPWGPPGESFGRAGRLSRGEEDSKLRTTKDFIGVPLVPNYLVVVDALTFGMRRTKEGDFAQCNERHLGLATE
ncbi:Hypp3766 [Branchiostoma lanceolatum]|uniref:Hypp3766 protein n=1 Tax=Branchiostoma lanceolatum TaxID=7740 RepID=A0A8K0A1I2_BRALA|nr:Hypp3766 [Branchiostoma lanceolatum]